MHIHWPEGLCEQSFIQNYWQKQALLIRGAFPHFDNPLPADELAGLACDEDIASRLISYRKNVGWQCRHGPLSDI